MIRSSKKSREKSKKMLLINKNKKKPRLTVVSLAAVFSIVTQRSWGGALRDDTKNGCEGD